MYLELRSLNPDSLEKVVDRLIKEIERGSAPNLLRQAQVSFESQIKSAIAINEDWKQKMKVREGVLKDTPSDKVASPSLITLLALLTSVPGIGEIVAVTLISSLPELGTISHKSISYLVGVAPLNKDSPKGFLKD